MLQTLNEILDYAKLDAKGGALHVAPLDLRRVCQLAVQTFQANATAKGIALRFDASGYPTDARWSSQGDEEKLRRIVMNLVSNAIKFTADGGVTLRLRGMRVAGGVKVMLRVADTGIGMPPTRSRCSSSHSSKSSRACRAATVARAWAWRFRANSSRSMGGSVRFRSKIGRGSIFTVGLRLARVRGAY